MEYETVSLVSEEDIKKEFDNLSIVINDTEVLDKLKELCIVYNMDSESLATQWFAFASSKLYYEPPNMWTTEQFEREILHRKAVAVQTDKLKQPEPKVKKPLAKTTASDTSILNDYLVADEIGQVTSVYQDSQIECMDDSIAEQIPQIGSDAVNVVSFYGEAVDANTWINTNPTLLNCEPYNKMQSDSYMRLIFHNCVAKLRESKLPIAEKLQSVIDNELLGVSSTSSDGAKYFIGRVITKGTDKKLTEKDVYLDDFTSTQKPLPVDLSTLSNYSLFPGQVIALKGLLNSEKVLQPTELLDPRITINSHPSFSVQLTMPLHVVFAAGPFTSPKSSENSKLKLLLEYVKTYKPDFLLLTGPFVDATNTAVIENLDPQHCFQEVMDLISETLLQTKTRAVVIPSLNDLHHKNIFPTPPFEGQWPNIDFAQNPVLLNVCGVVIASSSVDIILHLIRSEIFKNSSESEPGARIKRLCRHILSQRSFYPLSPPMPDMNMEYAKLEHIGLPVTPHLFFIPSDLKSFVQGVGGCVFVNPGRISKETFARVMIEVPESSYSGTLDKHINVEILKLN